MHILLTRPLWEGLLGRGPRMQSRHQRAWQQGNRGNAHHATRSGRSPAEEAAMRGRTQGKFWQPC